MVSSAPRSATTRPPPPAFSTRFLPTDGIPAYNALLDTHLGKRREFLLGNKRSLAHLARTGAIARVETSPQHPQQYVVYMHEPKPSIASRKLPPNHDYMRQSASTSALPVRRPKTRDEDEDEDEDDPAETVSPSLGASASTTSLPVRSASAVIDRLRRRRPPPTTEKPDGRSSVERLLESDAAYQLQLELLRDDMRVLETEKQYFDAQIATMRKRLRGVNAVRENDVAVAHCSAIMHARIVKAEEEYMKLVTAQHDIKTEIDTLRRELLAMRKVHRKLHDDIADVEATNAAIGDKIRAAKGVRNVLSQELVDLERRAELEADEQRLKLPPEETVVVDAHELMSAVQLRPIERRPGARRATAVLQAGSPLETLQRMLSERAIVPEAVASTKPLLSFRAAFRVIHQTLGLSSDVERFVAPFDETEDALLSKHKLNAQLQDELDQLEKEASGLETEAAIRHASVRGTQHLATTMQQALQDKIQHTLERTNAYNELRDVRNHEHTRLRAIMQRCLEILHAEKLVNSQESLTGPLLLSELSTPAMLEALQMKMTEVAITLKLEHNANSNGRDDVDEGKTRRSNLLLKRDKGSSKIVLGPREPSGAALKAIMITAQPPTVDGAQAMSETYAAEMHALHPSIIPPTATPTRAPRKLTIRRMASIRASKRAAAFSASGSMRRISAPATSATRDEVVGRPSRTSMLVGSKRRGLIDRASSNSLDLQPEDANARVVENADDLDAA